MSDAVLLQEIRDHRTYATNEWQANREEARIDRLCVAGKPWEALDPNAVRDRKATKRPYLALDELGQYINQTVNDVRANPRGIRYAPTGNGANDAGAEFYQNHTREIEYRSQARVGYATAFENAVTSGYGWIRIRMQREHLRSFNQDLYIDPIANPDQVLSDPNAVWPDSRDMKFLFFLEPWTRDQFRRRFPKAKIKDFGSEWARVAPQWIHGGTVTVAEYWAIQTYLRRLVAFRRRGSPVVEVSLVDELPGGRLPQGAENVREEEVEDTRVCCYLTNGIEILKEQKWPGKYIPFVSCFGKVLYVDEGAGNQRQVLSMTRLARDPYMLYCYIRTCEAEAIGGVPRATWVGYEGQFAKPDRWVKANREPVAYLEAKAHVAGNPNQEALPLPRKEPWDPPLQNLEIAAEAARRAIQAAMGIMPLPTAAQRRNDISGVAYRERESQGQRGSFHFVDHYDLMIERGGVILENLIDKTIDTARDVAVRKHDDGSAIVRVNDPKPQLTGYRSAALHANAVAAWQQRNPNGDEVDTKGEYRVTVSTGPATDSQREEARAFVEALVANLANLATMTGPGVALKLFAKAVKLKQLGPIGDEIIDLLDPPQMGQNGKPLPPEVVRLLGENKQLKALLQRAAQEKQAKVVEQEGKFRIASMQEQAETERAVGDREVKLAVAELGAKVERMALFFEESRLVGARAHERAEAGRDRLHASLESELDRRHERELADAQHAQALEAATHAAALAPAPESGAGASA